MQKISDIINENEILDIIDLESGEHIFYAEGFIAASDKNDYIEDMYIITDASIASLSNDTLTLSGITHSSAQIISDTFTINDLKIIYRSILSGIELKEYLNHKYSPAQLDVIFLGKLNNIDVSKYDSPNILDDTMYKLFLFMFKNLKFPYNKIKSEYTQYLANMGCPFEKIPIVEKSIEKLLKQPISNYICIGDNLYFYGENSNICVKLDSNLHTINTINKDVIKNISSCDT